MKNNFLKQLQDAAFKGRQEGILLGLDICAIVLHDQFGFGDKRLTDLEKGVQEILDEIETYKDTDRLAVDLVKKLGEIRKGDKDIFLHRYIKL